MVQGNMNLMNSDINMRNRNGELQNSRPLIQTNAPKQMIGASEMGAQRGGQYYQEAPRFPLQ